ncbi:MAG TPA: glycosyltransferase family 39 protein [Flavobacteriales bacterium]|nr:glycosyltransferase family 39 protein [Flavobacteriales bacterium]
MTDTASFRACAWLTLGVFLVFLLPRLAQDGMFMDGELYAAVAHNEANGYGTFWEPRFSQVGLAGMTTFHEHPPLVFGMQAQWFKLFGSGFWVERSYAFLTALVTAWLMVLLWRALVPAERKEHRMGWWVVLLWIAVPTVHWCYHNNMHENTMGMFTTAAVVCAVRATRTSWWAWHMAVALFVFLASMSKGLPGLFPIAAPVLLYVALRGGSLFRAFLGAALVAVTVVVLYALLMLVPEANQSLTTYVEQRLMHRIAVNPTVENRSASLEMLFMNMLAPLTVALVLVFLDRRREAPPTDGLGRPALAMLLVGLSGVAPLMLTMVQKSFYMAAALPIVTMAIALWSAPAVCRLVERMAPDGKGVLVLRSLAGLLIAGATVSSAFLFGTPGRDADLLHDVRSIGSVVPPHTKVGLPEAQWNDWSLQTYLMRYHFISVDPYATLPEWYITAQGTRPPGASDYRLQDVGSRGLDLWHRDTSVQ